MRTRLKPLVALVATAMLSSTVFAATQTLDAGNYTISYDDSLTGLFGTPTLTASGDLVFTPSTFVAQTGSSFVMTNSTFVLTITADAGYTLSGLSLTEKGDYLKFGSNSMVGVTGQLRVQDLVDTSMAYTKGITTSSLLDATATFPTLATTDWVASATLSSLQTTKAAVSLQNLLWATVPSDGYAFIEKKGVVLDIAVTAVPEPESYAMLLAGLGVMGAVVRRRLNA